MRVQWGGGARRTGANGRYKEEEGKRGRGEGRKQKSEGNNTEMNQDLPVNGFPYHLQQTVWFPYHLQQTVCLNEQINISTVTF